jgi:hypothetical protein
VTRFRRTLYRPTRLGVGDKRDPMLRLLEDGQSPHNGKVHVWVNYHEQHRTLWKAQRLGYVTDDGDQLLTDKGREYIERRKTNPC